MAINFQQKEVIVSEVAEVAGRSVSALAADYRGLTAAQMANLRAMAREQGIFVKVVRNTLARRAVEGTDFACLQDGLVGPLLLMFCEDHPGAAARLVREFVKDNEQLEVKLLALGSELLPASKLEVLASLPTYEEAVAQLLSVMLAPVTKLARTLTETYAPVVRVISAYAEAKN